MKKGKVLKQEKNYEKELVNKKYIVTSFSNLCVVLRTDLKNKSSGEN